MSEIDGIQGKSKDKQAYKKFKLTLLPRIGKLYLPNKIIFIYLSLILPLYFLTIDVISSTLYQCKSKKKTINTFQNSEEIRIISKGQKLTYHNKISLDLCLFIKIQEITGGGREVNVLFNCFIKLTRFSSTFNFDHTTSIL